ncbi:MAG: polyisoprenoid-binding protein YceI [Arenicella sp.]|jgi:polyisoprenoid-binding protein YceI
MIFNRYAKGCLILNLAMTLSGCVSLLAPSASSKLEALRVGQYTLDKSHATLLFKVEHFGLSKYVGRFNEFDATLDFDPENLEQTKLEAIIEMKSLDINHQGLRIQLLSPKWFDQANHPQAKLTTVGLRQVSESNFELSGNLAWRGINKPVVLQVKFNGGANNLLTRKYTIGFHASGSFLRSDYGIKTYLPIVGDQVKIDVYAEFH